jgi:hypothetical protein
MGTTLRIVGNGEKKIVGSSTQKVSEEDLLKAENQLRSEAKTLVREISHKYWDLGRVLYDVYDGVPGGYRGLMVGDGSIRDRTALFTKWGYKNFGEYCEQEVGLQKRTGENLRFAYYWFTIQQPMPESVIDELMAIGRSKVYLLSGIATRDSIGIWMEKAKELTFEELKKAIKTSKAVSAGRNVDNEEREMPDEAPSAFIPTADAGGGSGGSKQLQKPEALHTRQVGLYDAQLETWDTALSRAQGLTGSEKIGHNMELICQDFLANNDFSKAKDKDKSGYISKMERRLGVLIIAIDPNSGKPVHGRDLLWRMISESKEQTES